MKKVCVFCGSSIGNNEEYLVSAKNLGTSIAQRGLELIYGGANVGLMGMVAKSCQENGGKVTGIMPQSLVDMGVAKENLDELIVVNSMHERKSLMSDMSDSFIALPGGIGTIEETFEIFTWMQLGLHTKPIAILNALNFYDSLYTFLGHMVTEGFLRNEHLKALIIESEADILLKKLKEYNHKPIEKWFDKEKNKI